MGDYVKVHVECVKCEIDTMLVMLDCSYRRIEKKLPRCGFCMGRNKILDISSPKSEEPELADPEDLEIRSAIEEGVRVLYVCQGGMELGPIVLSQIAELTKEWEKFSDEEFSNSPTEVPEDE